MIPEHFTGSAFWAHRGAGAFRALAARHRQDGMHGLAADADRQAEYCENYLERYGARDSAAGDLLEALTEMVERSGSYAETRLHLARFRAVIAKAKGKR